VTTSDNSMVEIIGNKNKFLNSIHVRAQDKSFFPFERTRHGYYVCEY
jgi:hypothetical protein